ALPLLHVNVGNFTAATIGLTLWGSANAAEIVRGAVLSVPRGQFQAATALGMNWWQSMLYVIVAQAARRMIPPMIGLSVNLVQQTSLAVVIGVLEILESAQRSIERLTMNTGDSHAVPILGVVLLVFYLICTPLTRASRQLEARLR
ncbi:MAG: ABC transporter permease subunit, partial [bacterium]|nr:ABC transporter permease subunit [bacterium]